MPRGRATPSWPQTRDNPRDAGIGSSRSRQAAKDVLQRGLSGRGFEILRRTLRYEMPFVNNQSPVADLLHHVQHMGAVKDGFAFLSQGRNQILDHDGRVHVESRQRLIEK